MSRSTSLHWWHTLKSQCLCLPPTVSALLMGCLHHLFGANFAPNFAPKVSPLACHFSLLFLNRSQNLSHSFWTSLVQYTTSTLEPRVAISQSRNRKCKHLNLECGHCHGQPKLGMVWFWTFSNDILYHRASTRCQNGAWTMGYNIRTANFLA